MTDARSCLPVPASADPSGCSVSACAVASCHSRVSACLPPVARGSLSSGRFKNTNRTRGRWRKVCISACRPPGSDSTACFQASDTPAIAANAARAPACRCAAYRAAGRTSLSPAVRNTVVTVAPERIEMARSGFMNRMSSSGCATTCRWDRTRAAAAGPASSATNSSAVAAASPLIAVASSAAEKPPKARSRAGRPRTPAGGAP